MRCEARRASTGRDELFGAALVHIYRGTRQSHRAFADRAPGLRHFVCEGRLCWPPAPAATPSAEPRHTRGQWGGASHRACGRAVHPPLPSAASLECDAQGDGTTHMLFRRPTNVRDLTLLGGRSCGRQSFGIPLGRRMCRWRDRPGATAPTSGTKAGRRRQMQRESGQGKGENTGWDERRKECLRPMEVGERWEAKARQVLEFARTRASRR